MKPAKKTIPFDTSPPRYDSKSRCAAAVRDTFDTFGTLSRKSEAERANTRKRRCTPLLSKFLSIKVLKVSKVSPTAAAQRVLAPIPWFKSIERCSAARFAFFGLIVGAAHRERSAIKQIKSVRVLTSCRCSAGGRGPHYTEVFQQKPFLVSEKFPFLSLMRLVEWIS
jgi:hypothetical protein